VAFRAALVALAGAPRGAEAETDDGGLRLPVIQFVLSQCAATQDESLDRLIALLRRFEADAARERGRKGLARLREVQAEGTAPPVAALAPDSLRASENIPAPSAAIEAPEQAGKVEPMTEPLAETDIVVDLVALERELMAA
jgi:hypothetical protein